MAEMLLLPPLYIPYTGNSAASNAVKCESIRLAASASTAAIACLASATQSLNDAVSANAPLDTILEAEAVLRTAADTTMAI